MELLEPQRFCDDCDGLAVEQEMFDGLLCEYHFDDAVLSESGDRAVKALKEDAA